MPERSSGYGNATSSFPLPPTTSISVSDPTTLGGLHAVLLGTKEVIKVIYIDEAFLRCQALGKVFTCTVSFLLCKHPPEKVLLLLTPSSSLSPFYKCLHSLFLFLGLGPHDATNYLNEGGFPLAHASAGTMSSLVHHWFPDWQKKSQKSNSGRLAPTCLWSL